MSKNILIVVDYQNDFVTGSLGFPAAKAIEKDLADEIKLHWNNGGTVIFTYDTHDNHYLDTDEGQNLPIKHCIRGTDGWNLHGKVKEIHDYGVDNHKNYFDIFKNTFGSLTLAKAIEEVKENCGCAEEDISIEFCGVVTNICVISNAIIAKATMPNANIRILRNLCASNDKEMEEKAFDIMKNLHMEVVNN